MSLNDKVILSQILEQERKEKSPSASDSVFFETFVAEQVTKDHDLSYEELEAGLMGSGGDGGIDSIYVFVNGEMAYEDIDLASLKKNVLIEVVIVQAKLSANFKESSVEKMTASSEVIFDLNKDINSLRAVYNEGIQSAATVFREVYKGLASKFPALRFRFVYASTGSEVHPNVRRKADILESKIKALFSDVECSFEFLGASELLSLARRRAASTHTLPLAETPISTTGEVGYVCLVHLQEYVRFIRDDRGQLRRTLFEANVRDYQGSTAINEEIAQSLEATGGEDFWWLNNGITIIASKATQSGKSLTLEDPQIVNGLQTSTEIFRYFRDIAEPSDMRTVLVRVIVPTKAESRDRVIKATNSQTNIPPASLRATEKIHRDIEEYLLAHGLYYDRRKNYYKNEGRPSEKIIGIPLLAQAVMSTLLQRPDNARARPSSLFKQDQYYEKVFSAQYPIELYRVCASIVKKADAALRSDTDLEARERNNVRFYVSMWIAAVSAQESPPSPNRLASVDPDGITAECIREAIGVVLAAYNNLGGGDRVAKGPDLVEALKKDLKEATLVDD